MDNNVNELLGKLTEFLKNEAKAETVIGQPFQLGEFSCVPVTAIGLGIGGGGGEGKGLKQETGTGAGGGMGLGLGPLGFLVTRKEEIHFIPVQQPGALNAVFDKLPDLLQKYFDSKKPEKASTN